MNHRDVCSSALKHLESIFFYFMKTEKKKDDCCPMGEARVSGAQTQLLQVCLKQSHLLVEDTEQHGQGPVMLNS